MTRRRLRALASGAAALLALGCAGIGALPDSTPNRVTVLPLGVVAPLPPEVIAGAKPLERELAAYLGERGLAVDAPDLSDARAAWLRSAQALKADAGESGMSFDGAASRLARELHAASGVDALVLPWIAMRPAQMKGRMVVWDGVSRELERFRGRRAGMDDARYLDALEGTFAAPSLQVAVYSARGEKVYEGTGGLDLVQDVLLLGDKQAGFRVEMPPRDEIFSDAALLREGIALALDAYPGWPPARAR
jgi:hypothetical protein